MFNVFKKKKQTHELSGTYYMKVNDTIQTKEADVQVFEGDDYLREIVTVQFKLGLLTDSLDIRSVSLYDAKSNELVGMRRLPKVLTMYKGDDMTLHWGCTIEGKLVIM